MKIISTKNFKHTIKDIYDKAEDRKFCFILGAGASKSSKIPMGGELALKWFEEICTRCDKKELESWINEAQINRDDLAPSYGPIYRKRFETDKTSGYEYLVDVMQDASPSFGHIVLAKFLSVSKGHCVLTTNFDSLIESAIYQFTDETPLVCGHESLSGYAKASKIHPLIIKIHRDLLMAPKSLPREISKIDEGWVAPLDRIFSTHIPIVIGYGGNDGSLMSYLLNMNKPSNFFWCGMNEKNVSPEIQELVTKMEGNFVKIDGFDELMHQLLFVFSDIGPLDKELNQITKTRVDRFNTQLREITEKQQHIENISEDIANYNTDLSALEYYNKAMAETDYDKRERIFQEAIKVYPNTTWLWSNFIYFLQFIKRDYTHLDAYYSHALSLDPEDYYNNGNYAIYLKDIKKDYPKADTYYRKTISLAPEDATAHSNYAIFLDTARLNYKDAEKYHQLAIELDPNNILSISAYADFLYYIKRDYAEAEKYFLKSIELDPENPSNLTDYGTFLMNIKKDFTEAENMFHKAIQIDPNHPSINAGYAALNMHVHKNYDKAERYLKLAIQQNANKENFMMIYAQLLFIQGTMVKGRSYLDKAMELNKGKRVDLLLEGWFYRFAHFYDEYKQKAKEEMDALLLEGIRSVGWDFSQNIEIAIANGHPAPEQLKGYAAAISAKD